MTNRTRKKRIRAILLILTLAGLAVCAALCLTVLFPITEISVEGGRGSYTDEAIIEKTGLAVGDNLFAFSKTKAQNAICSELPYIESAKISRAFSGKITIEVSESSDVLALPCAGGVIILSENLKILGTRSENTDDATEIYGISPKTDKVGTTLENTAEEGVDYLRYVIEAAVKYELLQSISSVNVADKLNIALVYDDRFYVMLGTASDMERKMSMLKKVVTEELGDSETGYIDLSTAGRATVKSREFTVPEGYFTPATVG